MSFWEDFRNGRDQVRAAKGAPRVDRDRKQDRDAWDKGAGGGQASGSAELQAALEQRERELDDAFRLLAEMKEFVELQSNRVIELIGAIEPMANVLRLPGVKTFLLQRFHPDAHPNASAAEREALTEAMKAINAAYAVLSKEFQSAAD
jgi:hypothetical protein